MSYKLTDHQAIVVMQMALAAIWTSCEIYEESEDEETSMIIDDITQIADEALALTLSNSKRVKDLTNQEIGYDSWKVFLKNYLNLNSVDVT